MRQQREDWQEKTILMVVVSSPLVEGGGKVFAFSVLL